MTMQYASLNWPLCMALDHLQYNKCQENIEKLYFSKIQFQNYGCGIFSQMYLFQIYRIICFIFYKYRLQKNFSLYKSYSFKIVFKEIFERQHSF